MFFMSFLVWSYPYLHKTDNLCIDFKKKTVKYEIDQKRVHVLRTRNGSDKKFILSDENLKKLNAIIERRQSQEESVNEKVEHLQAEMKSLKQSIKIQHEEIKKLIQECLKNKET